MELTKKARNCFCTTSRILLREVFRESDTLDVELMLTIKLQGDLHSFHQQQECVRTRQCMEEVQGEPEM